MGNDIDSCKDNGVNNTEHGVQDQNFASIVESTNDINSDCKSNKLQSPQ